MYLGDSLLIVPYGIETSILFDEAKMIIILLIVPYGIETPFLFSFAQGSFFF